MWKALKAILEGKRGVDVYNALDPEDKKMLNEVAARFGVSRQQRRKFERNVRNSVRK